MKTKLFTTLTLAALVLTGCGSANEKPQSAETPVETSSTFVTPLAVEPIATPGESASADGGYLEAQGAPHVSYDDLSDVDKEAVRKARAEDAAFCDLGTKILWLKPNISYAERVLIEQANNAGAEIRGAEGFGTGTLKVYYHDDTDPVTLTVEK